MAKELTKVEISENGLKVKDSEIYQYKSKTDSWELAKLIDVKANHKYGTDKVYKMVMGYNPRTKKQKTFLVNRVIYAWYHGVAHEGMVIDHIDNNPFNNDIYNLQEITQEQNVQKRPGNGHNNTIYYGLGGLEDIEIDEIKRNIYDNKKALAKYRKDNSYLRDLIEMIEDAVDNIRHEHRRLMNNLKAKYGDGYRSKKETASEMKWYKSQISDKTYHIDQLKNCITYNNSKIRYYKDKLSEISENLSNLKKISKK